MTAPKRPLQAAPLHVPWLARRLDRQHLRRDLALYRAAAEFEERISNLVARDPELTDYVKQLKRREFAQ